MIDVKNIDALSPETLAVAVQALAEVGSEATVLAGGTDLMVALERGTWRPSGFILNISKLEPELRYIRVEDDELRIGALTSFADIVQSGILAVEAPSLVAAAKEIGAQQIQNRATIGGNIMNASPAGDSMPALLALDARVVLTSNEGPRTVPLFSFYSGYRETVSKPSELLTEVRISRRLRVTQDYFRKVAPRRAQAISKVILAARAWDLTATEEGTRLGSVRIGVGSVAPTPLRLFETERLLESEILTPALMAASTRMLETEISPIDDVRSTAEYRRQVCRRLLEEFLSNLLLES
ncbi:MAG: CO/xanthine dehydrogenase FAD-binding subunit [Planctomycetota bacterium]|jgi:CO/xanthine dehydrogenase FAD-binding subunit